MSGTELRAQAAVYHEELGQKITIGRSTAVDRGTSERGLQVEVVHAHSLRGVGAVVLLHQLSPSVLPFEKKGTSKRRQPPPAAKRHN